MHDDAGPTNDDFDEHQTRRRLPPSVRDELRESLDTVIADGMKHAKAVPDIVEECVGVAEIFVGAL